MKKFIKFLLVGICLIIGYVLVAPIILLAFGYYPWGVGWDVAQTIVTKHGTVEDCRKIIHPIAEPMSPTEGEQRSGCIYDYAKLTKDPSACELLMPSSYGLSCVGGATKFLPCLFNDERNVIWNDGERQEVPFDECSKKKLSVQGSLCCQAAASRFVTSFTKGCEAFREANSLVADQCQYEVALKEIEPNLCDSIQDENLLAACQIEVKTLLENPGLRSSYRFTKKL